MTVRQEVWKRVASFVFAWLPTMCNFCGKFIWWRRFYRCANGMAMCLDPDGDINPLDHTCYRQWRHGDDKSSS